MTDWVHGFEYYEKIRQSRAERAVCENTVNNYHIDTCKVYDRSWNFETGICHPDFHRGNWIIVRGYGTLDEAKSGHAMWCEKAKNGFQKLYDVFEEKIYSKERPIFAQGGISGTGIKKRGRLERKWSCRECNAIVERQCLLTEENLETSPCCPFCNKPMTMVFEYMEVEA